MPAAEASRRHAVQASARTARTTARRRLPAAPPKRRAPASTLSTLPKSMVLGVAGALLAGTGSVAAWAAGPDSAAASPATVTLSGGIVQAAVDDSPAGDAATTVDAGVSLEERARDSQAVSRGTERDLRELREAKLVTRAEEQADKRTDALAELAKRAQQRARQIDASQWVLPVRSYSITARFGESSGLWSSTHTGLDFAAPSGAEIVAIAGGKVVSTSYAGAYGNQTVVRLPDGTEMWYCHQTSFVARQGETVAAGDLLGYVGSTGNSTGAHLHLEIRPGGRQPVDPVDALAAHGIRP